MTQSSARSDQFTGPSSRDFTAFQAGARLFDQAISGLSLRTPVYAQLHDFTARQLRIPAHEFYTRPELMVPAILEIEARFGLDVASITYDVYNIEAQGLGQALVSDGQNMPDIDRSRPLICHPGDLAKIKTPDFELAGRFANVVRMHHLFRTLTGLTPSLSFCAPFTLAANLVGIERLLLACYTEPDFARELLDRLTEQVLAPWILYQKTQFPEATHITGVDAVASLPVINLAILKQWVLPYILRLRQLCGAGVNVVNWIGESLLRAPEQMLELKRLVAPGWIQGQDPDVEKLGPAFYKDFANRTGLGLVLGIGARFLSQSDPPAVRERVRRYLQVGKIGGRFALYLCNVAADTPPENLHTAVETAHEVGLSTIP